MSLPSSMETDCELAQKSCITDRRSFPTITPYDESQKSDQKGKQTILGQESFSEAVQESCSFDSMQHIPSIQSNRVTGQDGQFELKSFDISVEDQKDNTTDSNDRNVESGICSHLNESSGTRTWPSPIETKTRSSAEHVGQLQHASGRIDPDTGDTNNVTESQAQLLAALEKLSVLSDANKYQAQLICELREQVEEKDRKIAELEAIVADINEQTMVVTLQMQVESYKEDLKNEQLEKQRAINKIDSLNQMVNMLQKQQDRKNVRSN